MGFPGTGPDRKAPRGSARSARRRAPLPGRRDTPKGGSRNGSGSWKRSRAGFSPPERFPGTAPRLDAADLRGASPARNSPPRSFGARRGGLPGVAHASAEGDPGGGGRRAVASAARPRRYAPGFQAARPFCPECYAALRSGARSWRRACHAEPIAADHPAPGDAAGRRVIPDLPGICSILIYKKFFFSTAQLPARKSRMLFFGINLDKTKTGEL